MRILWVEDMLNDQEQKDHFFEPILMLHEVELVSDFTTAEKIIEHQLKNFDWFVLDINLEHSAVTSRVEEIVSQLHLTNTEFLQKSGMKLFLDRTKRGIPEERIVFLTGNTDSDQSQKYWVREIRKGWPRDIDRLKRAESGFRRSLSGLAQLRR